MGMASTTLAAPEEGAVSKNAGEVQGSTVGRYPGRFRDIRPDVAEFLLDARRRRAKKKPTTREARGEEEEEEKRGERARYDFVFEDEGRRGGFAPAPHRLVWAKVKGHPWWPGQVLDPAEASVLAQLERRRRGAVLVAFFWDKTFAWVADDAAELRPFRAGFPRHASNVPVTSAVGAALDEVARRVDAGLSCGCITSSSDGVASKKQVVENAGVRQGAYMVVVDAAFTRDAFRGAAFVEYVSALALAPLAGADMLDLAVATAQLKAFTRWRGTRCLPEYTASYGIEDIADGVMEAMPPRRASAKRGRSRRRGDDADADAVKRKVSRCRARANAACGNVDDAIELEDFEPSPQSLSHQMATKMGKLMSRAAQQMSQSPVICKTGCNEPQVIPVPGLLTRCTRVPEHDAPSVKLHNGGIIKDAPLLPALVLNFTAVSVVPPTSELVKIFSQFGPIKETRAENSVFVVIFKRGVDAEAAFAGTATIRALSPNLTSFRLTYSLLPADPPHCNLNTDGKDQPPVEVEVGYGCNLNTDGKDRLPVEVQVCYGLGNPSSFLCSSSLAM